MAMHLTELAPAGVACLFHLIDTICGIVTAIKGKELKSAKMRDGLFKKVGFIFCYILAYLVDIYGSYVGIALPINVMDCIVVYAVGIEMVSIIENIGRINPDILPDKLLNIFDIVKKEGERNG